MSKNKIKISTASESEDVKLPEDVELPEVHYGKVGSTAVDWSEIDEKDSGEDRDIDDDVELKETPKHIVEMLGFDPLEKE